MAKLKILLADDERDFLELMSVRIKEWGYDVLATEGANDAVRIFEKEKPDIVVLDYLMPEMDGTAVLKKIRKLNKKVPVVMFTVHPNLKVIKDADKLGISAFIPKIGGQADPKDILKSALALIEKNMAKQRG